MCSGSLVNTFLTEILSTVALSVVLLAGAITRALSGKSNSACEKEIVSVFSIKPLAVNVNSNPKLSSFL